MSITVFTGGTIIVQATLDGDVTTSDAIAFDGDRVVALGADAAALANDAAPGTEVVDLAGGTLVPGLGDGHAHPMLGGVEALGPQVREAEDLDGIIEAVRVWKEANPDAKWIVGASYDATLTPGGVFDAHWLDAVTGDTPTILRAWDYHTAWVNSAALEAGGITADTPDPHLGRIVRRDESAEPLGTLQEAAANNFLADVVPAFSLEQRLDAIERATKRYAAQGTTWVQDAWVEPGDLDVYLEAATRGLLHTRVNLAFRADPVEWRTQLAAFAEQRDRVREAGADRLSGETIKFFLDGVVESHTAALLEPYADRPDDSGLPNWTRDELIAAVTAFDALGFQLHLHAIGDAANRFALDALEAASAENPARERHHVVAHVALLDPAEIARFGALGVIANFEPYWAQCDAVMRDLTIPHLGHPRDEHQYLIGSVLGAGATITFGSDWPVTTLDWRPALATAITRRAAGEPDSESWLPGERVSAATALAAYTSGIARQALAPERGSLAVGQIADAAWLSANPVEIEPDAIHTLEVRGTWLAGDRTH